MEVKVGVSNRHVHLKKEHLDILFGEELTFDRALVQPGEFASKQYVTLKTDKDIIERVRVLGPIRSYTQVEIAKTDAYKLGINPPVRKSGDIKNSAPLTLVGPKGTVYLTEGCIIANRHIHLTEADVEELGLSGLSEVKILLKGEKQALLDHVFLKISNNYALELHIDTDDANANLAQTGDIAEIIK